MKLMHHTCSRSAWIDRCEKHLTILTGGRLDPVRYFQLACGLYEDWYDSTPEDAAASGLLPPGGEEHDEAIAACTAIMYLRGLRQR